MAPGGEILADRLAAEGVHIDPDKRAASLTSEEWLHMTRAFIAWPFRPKTLVDDIQGE